MKIIRIEKTFNLKGLGDSERELLEGHSYLFSDLLVTQLSYIMPENVGIVFNIDNYYREYKGESLDGKKLLCWRHGGIGDLMFMMPPLRILKNKYPTCTITVGVGRMYLPIFENIPYIDYVVKLPLDVKHMEEADYHLHFEKIIENSTPAKYMNAYDLYLARFKINPEEVSPHEKRPDVFLTTVEEKYAEKIIEDYFHGVVDTIVGIQIAASSPIRTFPQTKTFTVIRELINRGIGVVLFGGPNQLKDCVKFKEALKDDKDIVVKGRTFKPTDLVISGPELQFTLRHSMAILKHLDVVVAPDSALIHMAAGVGVPIVGLYGPFLSFLRMKYYNNAIGFNASPVCSPCFQHTHTPCMKGSPSPCFSLIDPEQILVAINVLLNRAQGKVLPDVDKIQYNKFSNVIGSCIPFMNGRGIDLGSGYPTYKAALGLYSQVTTVDQNPLCQPDIIGNMFEDTTWVKAGFFDHKYDFVISSFSVNTKEELEALVITAKALIKDSGGFLILYVGNGTITSQIDTNAGTMSNYLIDYTKSKILVEDITSVIADGWKKCYEQMPTVSIATENFDIIKTNFGILTVLQKL